MLLCRYCSTLNNFKRDVEGLLFAFQDSRGNLAGHIDQLQVRYEIAEPELWDAALLLPEQLAGPAQLQVGLGDFEAIGSSFQGAEALTSQTAFFGGDEDAIGLVRSPADPAA